MKLKLLILSLVISVAAMAQDSASIYMPFVLKQKYTAALVPASFTVNDMRLADSLRKAVGSYTNLDSQATVYFKAGTMLRLIENFLIQPVGGYYDLATSFFLDTQAGDGYSGLLQQLDYWSTTGTTNKAAATWLKSRVLALLAAHQASMANELQKGAARAKAIITYN